MEKVEECLQCSNECDGTITNANDWGFCSDKCKLEKDLEDERVRKKLIKNHVDNEIGNFILHFTSDEAIREQMMKVKEEYMGECYEE